MPFRKKRGNPKPLIDRSSNESQRLRKAITDIGKGKPEKIAKYGDNNNAVQVRVRHTNCMY